MPPDRDEPGHRPHAWRGARRNLQYGYWLEIDISGNYIVLPAVARGKTAMRQEYLIEAMDAKGNWYNVGGSDRSSRIAQGHMQEYRRAHPEQPVRVVEHPSGKIIALHDPRGKP